jgi:hypothetical protein
LTFVEDEPYGVIIPFDTQSQEPHSCETGKLIRTFSHDPYAICTFAVVISIACHYSLEQLPPVGILAAAVNVVEEDAMVEIIGNYEMVTLPAGYDTVAVVNTRVVVARVDMLVVSIADVVSDELDLEMSTAHHIFGSRPQIYTGNVDPGHHGNS